MHNSSVDAVTPCDVHPNPAAAGAEENPTTCHQHLVTRQPKKPPAYELDTLTSADATRTKGRGKPRKLTRRTDKRRRNKVSTTEAPVRTVPAPVVRVRLAPPRSQGDGDGLCGPYAIINALRLSMLPHGGLTANQEEVIWTDLIQAADRRWKLKSLFLTALARANCTTLVGVPPSSPVN